MPTLTELKRTMTLPKKKMTSTSKIRLLFFTILIAFVILIFIELQIASGVFILPVLFSNSDNDFTKNNKEIKLFSFFANSNKYLTSIHNEKCKQWCSWTENINEADGVVFDISKFEDPIDLPIKQEGQTWVEIDLISDENSITSPFAEMDSRKSIVENSVWRSLVDVRISYGDENLNQVSKCLTEPKTSITENKGKRIGGFLMNEPLGCDTLFARKAISVLIEFNKSISDFEIYSNCFEFRKGSKKIDENTLKQLNVIVLFQNSEREPQFVDQLLLKSLQTSANVILIGEKESNMFQKWRNLNPNSLAFVKFSDVTPEFVVSVSNSFTPRKLLPNPENCENSDLMCRVCKSVSKVGGNLKHETKNELIDYALEITPSSEFQVDHNVRFHLGDMFTMSAWIYVSKFVPVTIIAKGGYSWTIQYSESYGFLKFCANPWACFSGVTRLRTGQWYHVAVRYISSIAGRKFQTNGKNLAGVWFYVDGQLDKYIEHVTYVHSLGSVSESNDKLTVSKFACDVPSCGLIDDITVWSFPLDLNEIIDVAFRLKPSISEFPKRKTLIVWFCFQNETFPLLDCSENNLNGHSISSSGQRHNKPEIPESETPTPKTHFLKTRTKRPLFETRCD